MPGLLREDVPGKAKLERISVITLAFSSILKNPAHSDDSQSTLDFLDKPQLIASHYGIHHVEVHHTQFISTELPCLREFRGRVAKANSQMLGLSAMKIAIHPASAQEREYDVTTSVGYPHADCVDHNFPVTLIKQFGERQ